MKNILVPIGTSANSVKTLQYAIDFASSFGSKLYIMQAFTLINKAGNIANIEDIVAKSTTDQLEGILSKVDKKGVSVTKAAYNGDVLDGVKAVDNQYGIDLIILEPKTIDIREEVYLGQTSGSIVKKTNIPTLIVPEGNTFKPYKTGLVAFKSGIVKRDAILDPLVLLKDKFKLNLNLLLVKTPSYTAEDLEINPTLKKLSNGLQTTENTTTFEGVLEHFQENQPDILIVFRRKRGFFTKLWEKNIILKREFRCSIPLLVLSVKK
ncbi:universal stress protein [Galbibacter pacificus]|uniref:Universal stress protein n=1 Tax=Galbibacter pacificus TaxID=2996052 RepID=A0ABT6FS66_9FLAO|nr:universal stress protein [Galbibacter pacificus]MDG3582767.1 universal stress protein [Galbibacter pacificus]MDG3586114.1 universal stress protein [Galbibacter pacificus]